MQLLSLWLLENHCFWCKTDFSYYFLQDSLKFWLTKPFPLAYLLIQDLANVLLQIKQVPREEIVFIPFLKTELIHLDFSYLLKPNQQEFASISPKRAYFNCAAFFIF